MRFQRHGTHALGLVAGLLVGCGGAKPRSVEPAAARAVRAADPTPTVAPVRLFPPTDVKEATVFAVDRDGSRRLIAHGLRVLEERDGSIRVAEEFLPAARSAQAVELPPRLGSGFLFYVLSSNATLVWKSQTWTGKLAPLAQLDFEVDRVVLGFDRLYLQPKRIADWVALDLSSGESVDLGSLPRAPSYGSILMADSWFGAVEIPFRGVLVTFDAGASFRPLGIPAFGLTLDDGLLSMSSTDGRYTLDAAGTLRRAELPPAEGADASEAPAISPSAEVIERVAPIGPFGRRPLELAILHGWPDSEASALVAAGGAVGRVSLTDGSVLSLREHAYPSTGDCQALPLGQSVGFVCGEGNEGTQIYQYRAPFELHKVLEFRDARYVASSENGAVVIRGRCVDGRSAVGQGQAYCLRFSDGTLQEIYVRGDQGVERVVALRDKRAVVLIPPRLGAPGFMTLIEASGSARRVDLHLPEVDPATAALLKKGLWLDSFVEAPAGTLAGWVAGAGPFVGVRVSLDGKVQVGKTESSVEHALFSGRRALVLGRAGLASESVDGGFQWLDVDLPSEIDRGPDAQASAAKIQGCSPVGCAFEGWLRVGFGTGKSSARRAEAASPKPTRIRSPGGGRWNLACEATGDASAAAIAITERRSRAAERSRAAAVSSSDELTSTDWLPLLEAAPPTLSGEEIGFDAGTEGDPIQLHGYAWGARGADWGRVGQLQLKMVDRFRAAGGVWSTAVTRSPWPDAVTAAEAFGYETSGTTIWRALAEPSGRAGVLVVGARASADLFLFEEGRSITRIVNASRHGIAQLSGAVKIGATWYLGSYADRQFRIYRIDGTRVELVGEYRDIPTPRAIPATVVRSARGDALGIWARGTSWFVFPVDPASGEVHSGIEITPSELASMPRSCGQDEDGFLLEGKLDIEPYADFVGNADGASARSFEVRFLLTSNGLCVDALAAQLESAPSRGFAKGGTPTSVSDKRSLNAGLGRPGVPLVVIDRRPGGRRWGFRCR